MERSAGGGACKETSHVAGRCSNRSKKRGLLLLIRETSVASNGGVGAAKLSSPMDRAGH